MGAESLETTEDGGIVQREDGCREEGGILCASGADGESAHGDTGGHLDDGEEGIEAGELAEDWNAEDREEGLGRDHAGEMGSATGAGDDDANAAIGGLAGELCHEAGGAMGGDDA